MAVRGPAIRVFMVSAAAGALVAAVNVPCPAGTRVYSLSPFSGKWLDGMYMRCTGDSDQQAIPTEFNEDPGGDKVDGICAGTAGVQSIAWDIPSTSNRRIVYGNITCLNNATSFFAETDQYDTLQVNTSRSVSCQLGEYVHGLTYDIHYQEDGDYPYFLTYIGFMCSTAALDPICTACSWDATLRRDTCLPEYCEFPTCTSEECCQEIVSDSATVEVLITIATGLVITSIASLASLAHKTIKNRTGRSEGNADANDEEETAETNDVDENDGANDDVVNIIEEGGHGEAQNDQDQPAAAESGLSAIMSNLESLILRVF